MNSFVVQGHGDPEHFKMLTQFHHTSINYVMGCDEEDDVGKLERGSM